MHPQIVTQPLICKQENSLCIAINACLHGAVLCHRKGKNAQSNECPLQGGSAQRTAASTGGYMGQRAEQASCAAADAAKLPYSARQRTNDTTKKAHACRSFAHLVPCYRPNNNSHTTLAHGGGGGRGHADRDGPALPACLMAPTASSNAQPMYYVVIGCMPAGRMMLLATARQLPAALRTAPACTHATYKKPIPRCCTPFPRQTGRAAGAAGPVQIHIPQGRAARKASPTPAVPSLHTIMYNCSNPAPSASLARCSGWDAALSVNGACTASPMCGEAAP